MPYALGALNRLENDTVDMRFSLRGSMGAPRDIVIVAFDDRSFNLLNHQWPFPRRWDARVIDTLRADGARAIALDVQFTEPSDPTDDDALYAAVARARNVVLATTEVAGSGQTDVFGGTANLRAAHAVAAAANMPASSDGVIRRYAYSLLGLPSFAVATARVAGHPVAASSFARRHGADRLPGPSGDVQDGVVRGCPSRSREPARVRRQGGRDRRLGADAAGPARDLDDGEQPDGRRRNPGERASGRRCTATRCARPPAGSR